MGPHQLPGKNNKNNYSAKPSNFCSRSTLRRGLRISAHLSLATSESQPILLVDCSHSSRDRTPLLLLESLCLPLTVRRPLLLPARRISTSRSVATSTTIRAKKSLPPKTRRSRRMEMALPLTAQWPRLQPSRWRASSVSRAAKSTASLVVSIVRAFASTTPSRLLLQ